MCVTTQEITLLESSLQSSERTEACPGEVVTYTCQVSGVVLTWIVEPYIPEAAAVSFSTADTAGNTLVAIPEAVRVLTSTSPLRSTLTLNPTDDLMSTAVVCRTNNGASESQPYRKAGIIIFFILCGHYHIKV